MPETKLQQSVTVKATDTNCHKKRFFRDRPDTLIGYNYQCAKQGMT